MKTALPLFLIALAFAGTGPVIAGEPPAKPAPAAPDTKPEGARLSRDEALRLAREELARLKINVEGLQAPKVNYNRKRKSWLVFWWSKNPAPGSHFSISIDDKTGKAGFIAGL